MDSSAMSHKHESLLHLIFEGPSSGNIRWREIESLLHHLGATVEPYRGARVRVVLNDVEGFMRRPHHSSACTKQEIKHLREYLASAGVTLSSLEGRDSD
jgi:hypothetical protein